MKKKVYKVSPLQHKIDSLIAVERELQCCGRIFENYFLVFPVMDWVTPSSHSFMPDSKIIFCVFTGLSNGSLVTKECVFEITIYLSVLSAALIK